MTSDVGISIKGLKQKNLLLLLKLTENPIPFPSACLLSSSVSKALLWARGLSCE